MKNLKKVVMLLLIGVVTVSNFYFLLGLGLYLKTGVNVLSSDLEGSVSAIVALASLVVLPAVLIIDFLKGLKEKK